MDALGCVVGDQLGRRVARVELDLVDSGNDLLKSASNIPREERRNKKKNRKGKGDRRVGCVERRTQRKIGGGGNSQRTLQSGLASNFSRWVMPKLDTPMLRTFPDSSSFCISLHVSRKSQSA